MTCLFPRQRGGCGSARETLRTALQRFQVPLTLPTWDETIAALLPAGR